VENTVDVNSPFLLRPDYPLYRERYTSWLDAGCAFIFVPAVYNFVPLLWLPTGGTTFNVLVAGCTVIVTVHCFVYGTFFISDLSLFID